MLRNLLGFAVFAVIAMFLLKLLFGGLFVLIGLFFLLVKFAVVGFVIYLLLKVLAPGTAARLREAVRGR